MLKVMHFKGLFGVFYSLNSKDLRRLVSSFCLFSLILFNSYSQSDPVEAIFWDLFNNNQITEASEFVEKSIINYPDNYNYYFLRANVNLKKNKPDLVISDIEKYLNMFPPTTDVLLLKGEALAQKLEFESAKEVFYKALNIAKYEVVKQYCYIKIGAMYINQAKYKFGYEKVLMAKSIYSSDIEYLYNIGVAQINLGQMDEVEETKTTLLEMYPDEAKTYAFLIEYSQKNHNYDDALYYLEKKISLQPETPDDIALLKKLAIINNDTKMQISAYEKELSMGIEEYSCRTKLASLYCTANDFNKALIFVNEAININGEDPENYILKGNIYVKLNMLPVGCDCYFLALKMGYNTADGDKYLKMFTQNCEE
jgi:tetratricopeptide (TPR) repeat protein